jgi:hypothetical protein
MLLGIAAGPNPSEAQDSLLLRYRPRTGTVVHTVGWNELTVTIGQSRPDEFGAESLTVEVTELESLTGVVRGPRDGGFVVEVTFDSVRVRIREGGLWKTVPDSATGPVTGYLAVDSLHRAGALALANQSDVRLPGARRLRSLARRLALALPVEPVMRHANWTTDVVFPVNTPDFLSEWITAPALDLRGFATVAVDSVVTVLSDTLAYLRFDGVLAPPDANYGLEAALRLRDLDATFAGTYIWSTGWNAYVSGATRLLMNLTLLRGTSAGVLEGMEIGFDVLYRFQVRP